MSLMRSECIKAVSIHAPARGATSYKAQTALEYEGFNPRAREGRDCFLAELKGNTLVSIHAPARGATSSP